MDDSRISYLVDTGSDVSILSRNQFKNVKLSSSVVSLSAANSSPVKVYGSCPFVLKVKGKSFSFPFLVAEVEQNILGADFLVHFHLKPDLLRKTLDGPSGAISTICKRTSHCSVIFTNDFHKRIQLVIHKTRRIVNKPGTTLHFIDTGESPPVSSRPRRLFGEKLTIAKKYFEEMVNKGICRPSSSPWASPLHLVKKTDGSWRPCGDYRLLNQVTKPDSYPIKFLHDFISELHGKKIFSTIDIKSAFWQIHMSPESAKKTAISTPFGLFEFTRMPFGLSNASQTFQRNMDMLFRHMTNVFCYIDDVLIASESEEEHLRSLDEVFQIFHDNQFEINYEKSKFGQSSVQFLGFQVGSSGISPVEQKKEIMKHYPQPDNVKSLRRFLGMLNFYRQCIPKLSQICAPLYAMTEDDFDWTSERKSAFTSAKEALKQAVTLKFPQFGRPFHITSDASQVAIGAVLEQMNGKDVVPLGFFSRKLKGAELNYAPFDLELLAMREAVEHFSPIIEGQNVILFTDHKPLLAAFKKLTNKSPRQSRHFSFISEFSNDIRYVPGPNNVVADAFSRAVSAISAEEIASAQEKDDVHHQTDSSHRMQQQTLSSGKKLWGVMTNSIFRPILPTELRQAAFEAVHNIAHPSIRATRKALCQRYFWKNMNKDINLWASQCLSCQQAKVTRHTHLSPVQIPIPSSRFTQVNIDLVGPLPPDSRGRRYLLTMVDRFSRWPEAIPLDDCTAKTVARALVEHWFSRYGFPHVITTDRGVQFEGQLFTQLCQNFNIKHVRTAAYNPRANGLVERFHRTLKAAIMASGDTWENALPMILLALRTITKDELKAAPAELLFGTNLRTPADYIDDTPVFTAPTDEFVRQLQHYVKNLVPTPTRVKSKSTTYVPAALMKAEHVFVRKEFRTALKKPYEGPFKVLERSDRTFKIQTNDGIKDVSIERLKAANLNPKVEFQLPRGRGRPRGRGGRVTSSVNDVGLM